MNQIAFAAVSVALLIASVMDLRTRRVPNWITYPGILSALFWFNSKSLLYVTLALTLLLLPGNLIGSGDIKLGLFLALWSDHFSWSGNWLFLAIFFGGIVAIWLHLRKESRSIAFAPYLAMGFFFANLIL
jgi:leader peptidase (prepilin peptidase)/N-methyltransferase